MEHRVSFKSDGLTLSGTISTPEGLAPGEKRPAFIILHGFGSNKGSHGCEEPSKMFAEWGYAMLRFDMRGCGDSEGARGNLICQEQVRDVSNALTFLQGHPNIDPDRIGCMGSSFGGAVTVYAAGVDKRVAVLGFVSDAELARLYANAEGFVMLSAGEGLGLVYLEALLAGVPVLGWSPGPIDDLERFGATAIRRLADLPAALADLLARGKGLRADGCVPFRLRLPAP